jgi:2-polyprenyl-3-methyl-5-hydroxy-6-metoxy-1,4-benzoquinol methylase
MHRLLQMMTTHTRENDVKLTTYRRQGKRPDGIDMREGAIWAYRLLFNREPENSAAVDRFKDLASVDQLRAAFVCSEEYRIASGRGRVGEYRGAPPVDIQTECGEAELAIMLAGIAVEWRKFGVTEPHWSVLTGQEFLSSNIDAKTIEDFYATGRNDVAMLLASPARCGIDTSRFGRVMDFGCGVGRLALVLAERCDHLIGIDISAGHLKLAKQRAATLSITNVDFVNISHLNDLDEFAGFNLITSLIVLQHNPAPVQIEILRKLLAALDVGGIAVLQIPTYLVGQPKFSVKDYLANAQPAMEMNALPQKAIFKTIDEANCRCLEVQEDGLMGLLPGISNTFTIERKKT